MLGKTHLTMGMATSLLVMHPKTAPECFLALIGGALGGVAADIDTVNNDYKHDALLGQIYSFSIAAILLLIDLYMEMGICTSFHESNRIVLFSGVIGYLVLLVFGFFSEHRSFTHSLLAMLLFTIAIGLVNQEIVEYYLCGYSSHLLLDILNKKEVPILWPKKKGICLKLCYASKMANQVFMYVGLVTTVFLLMNSLLFHFY